MNNYERYKNILFDYSLVTNNKKKLVHKYIKNNKDLKIHKKYSKLKYFTVFDKIYKNFFKLNNHIPYVIYYYGKKELLEQLMNNKIVISLIGKEKYSYNDYSFVKKLTRKNKNNKYTFIVYFDKTFSYLIIFFLIKRKIPHLLIINRQISIKKFPIFIQKNIGTYTNIVFFNIKEDNKILLFSKNTILFNTNFFNKYKVPMIDSYSYYLPYYIYKNTNTNTIETYNILYFLQNNSDFYKYNI